MSEPTFPGNQPDVTALRDHFAEKAMPLVFQSPSNDSFRKNCFLQTATDAYALADAMLAARAITPEPPQ